MKRERQLTATVDPEPPADTEPAQEAPGDEASTLLELVLQHHETRGPDAQPSRIEGVVIGELAAFDSSGIVVTFLGGAAGGCAARSMAVLTPEDVGCQVALLFESGDPARPVVMGKMHGLPSAKRPAVHTDGERLELRAEREIVLSCGKASITLTRSGKILIRGTYLLSRSSGVHRIQGGSVQIN